MSCRHLTILHVLIGFCLIQPIQTEWVSYWIWNKGCRRSQSEGRTINGTVTDPAQCFERCDNVTNSVALQGSSCQCVENVKPEVYASLPDCRKCSGDTEVHCGNEDMGLYSYYEKVQDQEIISNIPNTISTCIAVKYDKYLKKTFQYIRIPCNTTLPALCYSATAGGCTPDDEFSVTWSEAVDSCVVMSSILIDSKALLDKCSNPILTDKQVYWIGIRGVMFIKMETTTETSESQPPTSPSTKLTTTPQSIIRPISPSTVKTPTSSELTTTPQSIIKPISLSTVKTPTSTKLTTTPQSIIASMSPSTVQTRKPTKLTATPQSIIKPISQSTVKTPTSTKLTTTTQSIVRPVSPSAVQTPTSTKLTATTKTKSIITPTPMSKASATQSLTVRQQKITSALRPITTASSHSTSNAAQTTQPPKPGQEGSTTIELPVHNSAKTRQEEKLVTDLNPPVARALVVKNNNSDLKTYYAAFGASILVLLLIIALFLGLIHRSVRKLVHKNCSYESRFRHRPRGRSRPQTFYRERSPDFDLSGRRTRFLPHVRHRDDAIYSAGVNNNGYMWDERNYRDDYHDDDLDNNVLNRYIEDSTDDFRNYNRYRSRPNVQPPLYPSYDSDRRLWREFM